MRHLVIALSLAIVGACGQRQVEVRTAADLPPETAVEVRNTLSQAVNVYVVDGGSEIFLRQLAAGAQEKLRVRGVPSGRKVTLRATTRDGSRTFSRENVVLQGTVPWTLP